MDNKTLVELLSSISFGQVLAWFLAFAALITGICTVTIKFYKLFNKYRNAKDENEKYKQETKENKESLRKISDKVNDMVKLLEAQKAFNYKQARMSIVHTCDEALAIGEITATKYKSLMEMYDEYNIVFADMHPNGYVKSLVNKIQNSDDVHIIGRLDED